MNRNQRLATAAISSLLLLGLSATPTLAAEKKAEMEKCYGIAKAGKNDCQTATSACAGTVEKDRESTAFLVVPKGTCDKIAGGSTSS